MKRRILTRIIFVIILLILSLFSLSCATERTAKAYNARRGLMLLENEEHAINKQYYSRSNQKKIKNYKKSKYKAFKKTPSYKKKYRKSLKKR